MCGGSRANGARHSASAARYRETASSTTLLMSRSTSAQNTASRFAVFAAR